MITQQNTLKIIIIIVNFKNIKININYNYNRFKKFPNLFK